MAETYRLKCRLNVGVAEAERRSAALLGGDLNDFGTILSPHLIAWFIDNETGDEEWEMGHFGLSPSHTVLFRPSNPTDPGRWEPMSRALSVAAARLCVELTTEAVLILGDTYCILRWRNGRLELNEHDWDPWQDPDVLRQIPEPKIVTAIPDLV